VGEQNLTHRVGHVVQEALAGNAGNLHRGQLPRAHPQEAGGDQALRVGTIDLVTGDLHPDEAIVGHVGI
jgi:hypothetical protein